MEGDRRPSGALRLLLWMVERNSESDRLRSMYDDGAKLCRLEANGDHAISGVILLVAYEVPTSFAGSMVVPFAYTEVRYQTNGNVCIAR